MWWAIWLVIANKCSLFLTTKRLLARAMSGIKKEREYPSYSALGFSKEQVLADYQLACESRQCSLLGRREVFSGKAKFGIFGDGKEVAQLAMAHAFQKGDFRAGYYRDQSFMMAIGALSLSAFFAQLYAHTDVKEEPASAGRMMNAHFGTRLLTESGAWRVLKNTKNSSADISCTAGHMPRLLGLAYASKLYRESPVLQGESNFSSRGNEVAWGTIGNASTSEGLFFESFHAAATLQVPMVVSLWDDDYGISVPKEYHGCDDLSTLLAGYEKKGCKIFVVKGWEYEKLLAVYNEVGKLARKRHLPVLIHVREMTQPQGHSTSGSHERYKSKERLAWEETYDCIKQMRRWMLSKKIGTAKMLDTIEKNAITTAYAARDRAWERFIKPAIEDKKTLLALLKTLRTQAGNTFSEPLRTLIHTLAGIKNPLKYELIRTAKHALYTTHHLTKNPCRAPLQAWTKERAITYQSDYSSHLHSETKAKATDIKEIVPIYKAESTQVDGKNIIRACFDEALTRYPTLFIIGEDVGKIGGVNQGLAGLQEKYGTWRVTDTSIREATIVGQGIGAAMRGLKPVVEIQYLDYLLFGLQTLSDDLATLHYRTRGGQKAPVIVRTRGHRLEGIWHAGSPMGMIIHSLRGMYVLVPRNMTQAAGLYNTMFRSDESALLIECLNGYRLKEKMPENVGRICVPLGMPEVLRSGEDVTVVTYGAMCWVAVQAAEILADYGVSAEVIDLQTLIPFDRHHLILNSLKKTSRLVVADEDVPGGASAYILQAILENQAGYYWLDSPPCTITARAHRTAYGSDGDYFCKPNTEDLVEGVYALMHTAHPARYPSLV